MGSGSFEVSRRGLVVTIGCPGSGKSTWADKNLSSDTLRLERDRFREALFGTRRAYHNSEFPRPLLSKAVTEAMLAAQMFWPVPSWAVTDTGIIKKAVNPFISHANRVQVPTTLVIFERSVALLKRRNRERIEPHRIPPEILDEVIEQFNAKDAWWRESPLEKVFIK